MGHEPQEHAGTREAATGRASSGRRVARALLLSRHLAPALLISLVLVVSLWRLHDAPALFWDEGWTLMVARNWVERGFYGQLRAGLEVPSGLSAAFPVVAPTALSFRLLGVGTTQGRLVALLFSFASLVLLYMLTDALYGKKVASGAVAVALLTNALPDASLWIAGHMLLAEVPMLLFLISGYLFLSWALRASIRVLPLAMLFWAFGIVTKTQMLPFWVVSLAVPLCVSLARRQWRNVLVLALSLAGTWGCWQTVIVLWNRLPLRQPPAGPPLTDLIQASAIVPAGQVRIATMMLVLVAALPAVLGVTYEASRWLRGVTQDRSSDPRAVVRLALLSLTITWLGWFALLSIGWPRYLLPSVFLSSMFVSKMLSDWTAGFSWSELMRLASRAIRHRPFDRRALRRLVAIAIIGWTILLTSRTLSSFLRSQADTSVQEAAEFLNEHAAPDALVEGYSSELFFLLDGLYHYPPDHVNVEMTLERYWGEEGAINYDPLIADPDYLVVCRETDAWDAGPLYDTVSLYQPALQAGAFRLLRTFGPYEVYERQR